MRVRKNVWGLAAGDPTLDWYGKAVAKMRSLPKSDPRSWEFQGAIHGVQGAVPSGQGRYWGECQHGTSFFLPWHRMYLLHFERIVAAHVQALGGPADWALPYWDYSISKPQWQLLPPAFRDTHSPLYVAQRSKKANSGQPFFDKIDIDLEAELRAPGDTSATGFFGNEHPGHRSSGLGGQLEMGVHNHVHGALGDDPTSGTSGWMGHPDFAALDPIFWIHHCNIDRLWEVWLRRDAHNTNLSTPYWMTGVSFAFHDATGAPVTMKPVDVLHVETLGYRYEDTSDPFLPFRFIKKPFTRLTTTLSRANLTQQRELVGATLAKVTLADQAQHVQLPTPITPIAFARGAGIPMNGFAPPPPTAQLVGHATLQLDNVTSTADSPTYDVYLNVPVGAEPADHPENLVGRASMFGIAQASDAASGHGGGQTFAFDVTDLYHELHDAGDLDPQHLRVSFVPIRGTNAAPVTVGRISLYFS